VTNGKCGNNINQLNKVSYLPINARVAHEEGAEIDPIGGGYILFIYEYINGFKMKGGKYQK
jgi:hypothetical protein